MLVGCCYLNFVKYFSDDRAKWERSVGKAVSERLNASLILKSNF